MDKRISLENITFIRNRRVILDDLSWTINAGEHWAVMGANGSGKTSLLQIIAGYLWPTRGQVTVLGERFGHTDLRELRKKIGWVGSFLEAQIPSGQKPLDIVVSGKYASIGIFGKPGAEDYEEARAIAELLGCGKILDSTWGVLSQGEKQRLLIARAMIHNPRLLILDEPSAGLDVVAREQLLRTFERLGHSADAPTMVLVTHQLEDVMPVFTSVFLLKQGRCMAQGPKEMMLDDQRLTETFGIPMQVTEEGRRYWARVSLP